MQKLEKLMKMTNEDLVMVHGGASNEPTATSFRTNDCTDTSDPEVYDFCDDSDEDYSGGR